MGGDAEGGRGREDKRQRMERRKRESKREVYVIVFLVICYCLCMSTFICISAYGHICMYVCLTYYEELEKKIKIRKRREV